MKTYWNPMVVVLVVTAVLMSGCGSKEETPAPVSDRETLQGTWVGAEVGQDGQAKVVFTDNTIHFTGTHPQEWYKGTMVLNEETTPKQGDFTISECPLQDYVGKVAKAIYKLEGDTLTMAGSEPGDETRPAGFDGTDGTRVFQFTRQVADQE